MRAFLKDLRFMLSDTWKSRSESVPIPGVRRFYRDLSGPVTPIGSAAGMGMSKKRIEDMKEAGLKPDFTDNGPDHPPLI